MQSYEEDALQKLANIEDLAEKKLKIYSRLLINPALAKEMETLSMQHEKRKEALLALTQSGAEEGEK